MKRVIVFHQGALGDLILSLPVIRSIRHACQHLHLVSRTDLSEMIIGSGIADRVSSHEHRLIADLFGGGSDASAAFLSEYDAAFVFARAQGMLYEAVRQHLFRCLLVKTIPPPGVRMHVSDYQLRQLRTVGLQTGSGQPPLQGIPSSPVPSGKRIICIHPGSGGVGKCWPLERYLELMVMLRDRRDCHIRVVIGPAEDGCLRRAISDFFSADVMDAEIAMDQPLSVVASFITCASVFIGNDSGISHLACALGVPTVAIFGPTDDILWRPRGESVQVLSPDYPCSPCGDAYRECPQPACLETISVERVAEAAVRLLRA